jgi:asparagine synthase (glutamine-hydrolysing)
MCGFAGWFTNQGERVDTSLLERLGACLHHRGPDDRGLHVSDQASPGNTLVGTACQAALVHNRLSIIDLSECGHQPMYSDGGRYGIIFNGEIFNYRELRAELQALGHSFRSGSDTEVLLRSYQQWGAACLERLVGMFAFAVLDTATERLFLARDFFGIKPLYYCRWRGGIAFASEIKALLSLPGVERVANPQRIYDYLRFGLTDHGDETMFEGIRQLPAAHYLELRSGVGVPEPVRYWRLEPEVREISFRSAADEVREHFLDNLRLHLRSDVPVGAALSGGIDSSAIVAGMRYLEPDLDLHVFSYVADDPRLSEERWVDLVGHATRARVHKVRARPEEMVRDLDSLIRTQDEPFGTTSIYAQFRVFRLAHETGIKVMLDGQGADELLGGYRPFLAARAASLIRQGRWAELLRFVRTGSRALGHNELSMLHYLAGMLLPDGAQEAVRKLTGAGAAPRWLRGGWFRERGVRIGSMGYIAGREVLRGQLLRQIQETSLPMLLRYEDRNSMAWSVESRVPFLTPGLAELILSLPEQHIITPNGTSKAVFRAAMRGIVPDAVLDRTDKIGFATPEATWMAAVTPHVEAALESETAAHCGALNLPRVRQEWEAIRAGRRPYDYRVWRWLNLVRWAELLEVEFT